MPLCSDEIYWGEIRATNLPPRHHTTYIYMAENKRVSPGLKSYSSRGSNPFRNWILGPTLYSQTESFHCNLRHCKTEEGQLSKKPCLFFLQTSVFHKGGQGRFVASFYWEVALVRYLYVPREPMTFHEDVVVGSYGPDFKT